MRSPIEILVDQACGVSDRWQEPETVRLMCPICGRLKRVSIHETDPDGTATVEYPCNEHDQESMKRYKEPVYWDVDWNMILPNPTPSPASKE